MPLLSTPTLPQSQESDDLGQVVLAHLSRVQERLQCDSSKTLTDLKTTLSSFSDVMKTCIGIIKAAEERPEGCSASTAVKEIKHVLGWEEFEFDVKINPTPIEHEFLFRAAVYRGSGGPGYQPPCGISFDHQFRRSIPVDTFVEELTRHLGKIQTEKETGQKVDTIFQSASPSFEWAVHATGQMSRSSKEGKTAGLVIFDRLKMQKASGVTVIRVSDIVRFLESRESERLIPLQLRQWARNCDEYVMIGGAIRHGMVRWIPWAEIRVQPIISDNFVQAYTLGKYREWEQNREVSSLLKADEACKMVVESAKGFSGGKARLFLQMLQLILEPRASFWGLLADVSDDLVAEKCNKLAIRVLIDSLSDLSSL